jgi:3-oxoacyl-[acyl-carrier protein] reductase
VDFLEFGSIKVGDTRTLRRRITELDVATFVELTGDNNPLHVDEGFAQQTSFQKRVVHGMLGASFVSTVIGTQLPGPGALWLSQTFEFLKPVRLNDELTISCEVTAKHEKERVLDVDAMITNQIGEEVLRGSGRIQVLNVGSSASPVHRENQRRCALITGASGGIGKDIALALASSGHDVLIHFHSDAQGARDLARRINDLHEGCRVEVVQGDLTKEREVGAVADRSLQAFGRVDILVNAASPRFGHKTVQQSNWNDISEQLEVHMRAPFLLSQALIPSMRETGWGRIINISSDAALGEPTDGWMPYGVAKAALVSFTQYLAHEVGRFGITANCVSPGMCRTPFIMDIPEKVQMMTARNTPTRRIAEPRDVASLVQFLCQDESRQINGQTLHVNGGIRMS